ncbi:hypothetical protein AVEN_49108-1 [Araneus ventricosus]|uniref:DUF4817 domain-containing protein n=1 Tax=Araneus ventricosus TaxID=182803 RepID=A0A4Y2C0I4_ARAVE|nr:hypothetical protein AVEN_49108-1 [Araneus ventricosus]
MYSIEQRVFLVLEYHRLERSPTATRRSFQKRFNVPKGPDANTIRKLFAKFERAGSVNDNRVENVGPSTQLALEDRPRIEWFIQDGTRPHHIEKVFRFLGEYFGNRVIALDYPKFTGTEMDWPTYSPYLTPCDYFLWGALKDTVYGNHRSTLDEPELTICVACNSISVETLKDVMSNFILRLRHLIFSNGEHFENIVFRLQRLLDLTFFRLLAEN